MAADHLSNAHIGMSVSLKMIKPPDQMVSASKSIKLNEWQ